RGPRNTPFRRFCRTSIPGTHRGTPTTWSPRSRTSSEEIWPLAVDCVYGIPAGKFWLGTTCLLYEASTLTSIWKNFSHVCTAAVELEEDLSMLTEVSCWLRGTALGLCSSSASGRPWLGSWLSVPQVGLSEKVGRSRNCTHLDGAAVVGRMSAATSDQSAPHAIKDQVPASITASTTILH
ncbi:transmembrane protein 97, partial [Striga asiatica]